MSLFLPCVSPPGPGFFLNAFANEKYVLGLAEVQRQGLAEAVGVSNFNKDRTINAARTLVSEGSVLASNQVCAGQSSTVPARL